MQRRARTQAAATIAAVLLIFLCTIAAMAYMRMRADRDTSAEQTEPTKPHAVYTVLLDPGHGGADTGEPIDAQSGEADYVLALCHKIGDLLEREGCQVFYTRDAGDGETLTDRERVALCDQTEADLFLSLHTCLAPGAYYSLLSDTTERSALLAGMLGQAIPENQLEITRVSGVPGVRLSVDPQAEDAEGIADAILSYLEKYNA